MADGYNIKIGLDSRAAERGVKSFTSALTSSFKALREFDKKATDAFKALDQFSKLNTSNVGKSMKGVGAAVNELNKIKINKTLVNNLQSLSRALNGVRFTGGDSLKKLPEALKGLNAIKINTSVVTSLNELKAATKGFTGPPKGLAEWPKVIAKFGAVKFGTSLPNNLSALKTAMRGFSGPSKSAMNLPVFLKQLSTHRISPSMAANLAALKASVSGFTGPSARAGTNLASLLNAMKGANAAQINQIAAALQRLNGIRINIGGGNGLSQFQRGLGQTNTAMRDLAHQSSVLQAAMGTFQAAVGGLSLVGFAQSIYETGAAYQSLQRTLGSVAASQEEVASHLQFIDQLTTKMPISIEAAATSYKKFAVAAGLSGMSIKDTQETFENFSTGFSAMGLSVESQKYAFIALEQMVSKGQVQMEELKTQLGDHLPGAVQLMATALDVPVAKLMKMIEAGEVTSDAIIKMGKTVKTQFSAAAEAAVNSTQGQFTALQNAWWKFKDAIFNSGFDSALGAMAKSLADIMSSDKAIAFAKRLGDAFSRAFEAIAVGVAVLADNEETVVNFFKAFAAYSAITAAAQAMRLLSSPVLLVAASFALLSSGSKEASAALLVLGGAAVIKGITNIGGALNKLASRAMLVAGGLMLVAVALDRLFNNGDATKSMVSGIKSMVDYMGTAVSGMGDSMGGSLGAIYDKAGEAAKKFADEQEVIAKANFTNEKTMAHNAEERARQEREKLVTLSDQAIKLWEQINPIGKANEEYQKQLKLLDEIAKKRNLTDEQKGTFRKILDAQSLEDRDPMAAQLKDMREELANAKAKTAEQRAFNDAKKLEQDMLKKGVEMSAEQVKAAEDYYKAIAKMNGELGNGFERWAATVGDFNDNVQEAIKDSIGELSNELAAFATGAEADFGKLAQSILQKFAQIALDAMFKDVLGAMGMDGEKNGASAADAALAKIASMGSTINTQMVNLYTNGLNIDGAPADSGLSNLAAHPVIPVERGELPLIPGTTQMYPEASSLRRKAGELDASRTVANAAAGPATITPDVKLKDAGDLIGDVMANGDTSAVKINNAEVKLPEAVATKGLGLMDVSPSFKQDAFGTGGPQGKWNEVGNYVARGADKVDPRLKDILETTAERTGLKVDAYSGWRPYTGKPGGTGAHTKGLATDVKLIDPNTGKSLSPANKDGHYQTAVGFREQEKFAQVSRQVQMEKYPELKDDYRWGGYFNSKSGPRGYGALDGMHYDLDGRGQGRMGGGSWKNGLTPQMRAAYPGIQSQGMGAGANMAAPQQTVPPIDATVTNSIQKVNTELGKTGAALDQAYPGMQQLNTTVQQTGSQSQMAAQQKQMATQTEVMGAQQASMGMQQAGINAQQAGPQFMQAGVQIGQAGAAAQTAGTQAATTTPGLGQFGTGIQSLLGPLSSAIPGLGQFGSALISLLGSLGGGGGGMGIFKEGGLSTQPVQTMNVPHFAEGTANTSGGIPSVLHPNEAVIPLTRGRKVAVEMGDDSGSKRQENIDNVSSTGMRDRPTINVNITTPDPNAFRKSKRQVQMDLASSYQRSMQKA